MTPTFIALVSPKRTDVKAISRDMNITFVIVIEAIATTADLLLLQRFTRHRADGREMQNKMVKEMWIIYAVIWSTICADITAKVCSLLSLLPRFLRF